METLFFIRSIFKINLNKFCGAFPLVIFEGKNSTLKKKLKIEI